MAKPTEADASRPRRAAAGKRPADAAPEADAHAGTDAAETAAADDPSGLAELRARKTRGMRAELAKRRAALRQQEAERRLPLQLLYILLNSLGAAIVAAMIAALVLRNLPGDSPYLGPELSKLVLVMSFLLGFFITLLFLMRRLPPNWWQLANEFATTAKYVAPADKWGGVLKHAPAASYAPLFDTTRDKGEAPPELAAADGDAPFTQAPPPPEPVADAPGEGAAPALFAAADSAPPDDAELLAKAKAQAAGEVERLTATLAAALRTAARTLDSATRFALQLYLAGACSAAARKFLLSAADAFQLLVHALIQAGTGKAFAESFALNVEDYAQRAAYRGLIQAGHGAMDAQLRGEAAAAGTALQAIDAWAGTETKPPLPRVVTFLFTDIVDARALTQRLGNLHAQRIVKAHDAAVREALAKAKGKEVRHTGDGIIATFPDPARAVAAAQTIQQQLDQHNKRQPHLSANVRIAINAGEVVEDEGGFFGAALKGTALVCEMAKAGQILAADVIKTFCRSSPHLFTPFGELAVAELNKTRLVFEIAWLRAGAGLDYGDIGGRPLA
jgi:adenylate cyclase